MHPIFENNIVDISAKTLLEKPSTPLCDRIANSEAMLLSFLAEKSLPFSLAPDLPEIVKEMSKDRKALNRLTMYCTTASYKLRFGVPKTIEENLIEDLKKAKFSFNIDESTSNNNEKVVTALVNFYLFMLIVNKNLLCNLCFVGNFCNILTKYPVTWNVGGIVKHLAKVVR